MLLLIGHNLRYDIVCLVGGRRKRGKSFHHRRLFLFGDLGQVIHFVEVLTRGFKCALGTPAIIDEVAFD